MAARRARRLASSFASAASALSAAADADSSASSRSRRAEDDRSRGVVSRVDRAEDDAPRDVFGALPPGGASAPPLCRDATLSGACRNAASFESTGWVKSTLKSLCVARFFRKKAMTRKL